LVAADFVSIFVTTGRSVRRTTTSSTRAADGYHVLLDRTSRPSSLNANLAFHLGKDTFDFIGTSTQTPTGSTRL